MKKRARISCEMCSAEVSNPTTIKVEGALLQVCPRCTSFGNIVREKRTPLTKQSFSTRNKPVSRSRPPTKKRSYTSSSKSKERELIDDFADTIRQARQKKKLSHEKLSALTGITVATLKSVETGKMRPTDRDAKKIERELNIVLFSNLDVELEFSDKKNKKATTLGDIAVIKRYEYDKD